MIPRAQFLATRADMTGAFVNRILAKQQGGHLQSQGGFAYSVRAGKEIGVSQPSAFYGPRDEGYCFILTKNRKYSHAGRSKQAALPLLISGYICLRWRVT